MKQSKAPNIVVRRVLRDDISQVLLMISEHANYEKAAPPSVNSTQLQQALFSAKPELSIWAATVDGKLAGYISFSPHFATWSGEHYMHLDCLYLRESFRSLGIGMQLINSMIKESKEQGMTEIQWQTPLWNQDAIRFYQRLDPVCTEKLRFTFAID